MSEVSAHIAPATRVCGVGGPAVELGILCTETRNARIRVHAQSGVGGWGGGGGAIFTQPARGAGLDLIQASRGGLIEASQRGRTPNPTGAP